MIVLKWLDCRFFILVKSFLLLFVLASTSVAYGGELKEYGIYINESTVEKTSYFKSLINESRQVGINTFVIDARRISRLYQQNLGFLKGSGIKHVARIVFFEGGGNHAEVHSKAIWEKKFQLAKRAIELGASEIQLDYIRYSVKNIKSQQNAHDINDILSWFKSRLKEMNIPLQVDVFGEACFIESTTIGQSIPVFSKVIDVLCPMVYPSHYEPFLKHAQTPYETIFASLVAVKHQLKSDKLPFRLIPFIELFNYRYPMSHEQRKQYIKKEMRAVSDAGADGWYVWSASNRYGILFEVLRELGHHIK